MQSLDEAILALQSSDEPQRAFPRGGGAPILLSALLHGNLGRYDEGSQANEPPLFMRNILPPTIQADHESPEILIDYQWQRKAGSHLKRPKMAHLDRGRVRSTARDKSSGAPLRRLIDGTRDAGDAAASGK